MIISPCVVIAVSLLVAPAQASFAEDSNYWATARVVELDFKKAPVWWLINYLALLTCGPVVAPLNTSGTITYKTTQKVTQEEAVQFLCENLASNGLHCVRVNGLYYRLLTTSETNKVVDAPHIEVEVKGDKAIIDGRTVSFEELTETVANSITAETEVWVGTRPNSTSFDEQRIPSEVLTSLYNAKARKIYHAYFPPTR